MKTIAMAAIVAAMTLPIAAPMPASADAIERACLQSDRARGNRALCGCIQTAADATLTGRDQRMGAKFFTDPDEAQQVRQSDRRSHEEFWQRWRNFGDTAEALCS